MSGARTGREVGEENTRMWRRMQVKEYRGGDSGGAGHVDEEGGKQLLHVIFV